MFNNNNGMFDHLIINRQQSTNKNKAVVHNIIYKNLATIIKSKDGKKELIDLLNKHIEQLGDKMPRVRYNVGNAELAKRLNKFITSNNKKFNQDLSVLIHRNMVKTSNADGSNPEIKSFDGVSTTVQEISATQNGSKISNEAGQDAITLALINQGIEKKKFIRGELWPFLLFLALIAGFIFLVIKYGGKAKEGALAPSTDITNQGNNADGLVQ